VIPLVSERRNEFVDKDASVGKLKV
jgi:hypothetical protein